MWLDVSARKSANFLTESYIAINLGRRLQKDTENGRTSLGYNMHLLKNTSSKWPATELKSYQAVVFLSSLFSTYPADFSQLLSNLSKRTLWEITSKIKEKNIHCTAFSH